MKGVFNKLASWPFYCLVLPLLPVIRLSYINWNLLNPWNLIRPMIVLVLATIILTFFFALFFRDRHRSSFMAIVVFMLFFFYWDLRFLLYNIGLGNEFWAQLAMLLLIILFFLLLWQRKDIWPKVTSHLNFAAFVVLVLTLGLSVYYLLSIHEVDIPDIEKEFRVNEPVGAGRFAEYPDIYYIVLDGYGRQDVLRDLYRYDNSAFIDKLEAMGFLIPEKSRANYNQTILSLCASLNMNNLEEVISGFPKDSTDRRPMIRFLENNQLFRLLKKIGYRIVAYDSGYSSTELRRVDDFISNWRYISNFENYLLTRTPLSNLANRWAFRSHAQRIQQAFKAIAGEVVSENPCFFFFHIVCPHPPFIFERNGELHLPEKAMFQFSDGNHLIRSLEMRNNYRVQYLHQLAFVSDRIVQTVEQLIANSKQKGRNLAVIIQGDHGPGAFLHHESFERTNHKERLSILNAYYFDGVVTEIAEDVTPANSFRLLLNHYFGFAMPLAEDLSFFVRWSLPCQPYPVRF